MPTYPSPPVTFIRGAGSRLWDGGGKCYLDFLCGIAVTSLGHCHPAVVEALSRQAATLWHVSNLYGNPVGPAVAEVLDRLLGGGGRVFLANSGAEANECALKLARRWGGRGRHGVVSAYGSFHGRTLATLAATGQPSKHEAFQPLPEGFRHVAWDDLEALSEAVDPTVVAAVLMEPIQGETGVVEASPGYLAGVRRLCDERGVLLMVDEIQTGLGRTGRWWGFEHEGIRPDVVTVAKALGNGMPVGACWARAEVAGVFRPGDHATTFGGQPLASAAARATLEVMESHDVPARAATAGARLRAGLEAMSGVASVRGKGLLLGAVLAEGLSSADVAAAALTAGLVVNPVAPGVVRLAPSLLVSDDEVDEGLGILGQVLG
ncbi:MAG: acetylornithine transaminase [Acidimicrobiales bacterium]|nr:MAG: acetylornithine transaminase [Acidimicrobiales bacterium]